MVTKQSTMKVGTRVRVPWGLTRDVFGTIVDVWGDPPAHFRVRLDDADDGLDDPIVVLLAPADVTAV